eukprot:Opistho-2@41666
MPLGAPLLATQKARLMPFFSAADSPSFSPIALPLTQAVAFNVSRRVFNGTNVVAALVGSSPEAVVFSGHLDHLGTRSGAIYTGAIDNASGAAMVLALARAFASSADSLNRTVVFLFPTGEEAGLLGSDFYAGHPTAVGGHVLTPIASINFDIGNVWGRTGDVSVLGQGKSDLADIIDTFGAAPEKLRVSPDPAPSTGLFFRSDHFSFARRGIPGVWLYLGRDFVGKPSDFYDDTIQQGYFGAVYHTPLDTYDASWDLTGMIQQLRVAYRCGSATQY